MVFLPKDSHSPHRLGVLYPSFPTNVVHKMMVTRWPVAIEYRWNRWAVRFERIPNMPFHYFGKQSKAISALVLADDQPFFQWKNKVERTLLNGQIPPISHVNFTYEKYFDKYFTYCECDEIFNTTRAPHNIVSQPLCYRTTDYIRV